MGLCEFIREAYLDFDDHGNWRTMHRYECVPISNGNEELKCIEEREIAYSKEDIPKLEDSYAEAEYYLTARVEIRMKLSLNNHP